MDSMSTLGLGGSRCLSEVSRGLCFGRPRRLVTALRPMLLVDALILESQSPGMRYDRREARPYRRLVCGQPKCLRRVRGCCPHPALIPLRLCPKYPTFPACPPGAHRPSLKCQFRTLGAHELKASRTRHQQLNPAYKRSPVDGMRVPLVLTLVLTCFLRVLDALRLGQLQNALVVPANSAITFARRFL
jgi:hypothetical protein